MEENQVHIPDGWHLKQVQEFALKMRSGGTPKSDNPKFYNGKIPFVAIDDLTSANKYLEKTQKHINIQGLNNSAAWLVPVNTIMYSIYATLGVPRINLIEAATNQAILNIIPDERKITLEFLFYLLLEKRSSILAHSAHTTQSNLNAKIVKELEFVFPKSPKEQTQIAAILSKVDEAITQTEQLIAKYTRIKTGLMQDLLTKGIDVNGNIRSEETHEFKDSPLGRIPKEWDVKEIDDVVTEILDFKANGSFETLTANVKYYYEQNYARLIRLTDLRNDLKIDGVYIDEKGFQFLKKTRLVEDDILIACVGEYTGFVCRMPKVPYHSTIAPNMFVVRYQKDIYNPFIYRYMNSTVFQNQILIVSTSSATKLLNNPNLRSLKIPIISFKEQKIIADKFETIDSILNDLIINLSKIQSLKTGLMQDLLSGKVRVNHLIKGTKTV